MRKPAIVSLDDLRKKRETRKAEQKIRRMEERKILKAKPRKPISREIEDRREDQEYPPLSPAAQSSLAPEAPLALPTASLAPESSQAPQSSPAAQSGLKAAGYLRLPNEIVDRILPSLAPDRQAVYLQLYRLSWGFGSAECKVSLPGLCRRTGVSERQISRALQELQERGLIEKLGAEFGKGKEQGTRFRIAPQSRLAAETSLDREAGLDGRASNKKNLKIKYLKIAAPLREAFTGASYEQFEAACRRKIEQAGLLWNAALLREALGG